MSNYLNLDAARFCSYGAIVRTGAQTFPQAGPGTATLYTVHTGAVLVTLMMGLITTVPGGDPGLTIGTAPTLGTAETNGLATTVSMTSEAGTWISLVDTPTTNKPGAISFGAHAGNVQYNALAGFAMGPGAITWTAANAETGAVSWYLTYIPLDEGAYVGALGRLMTINPAAQAAQLFAAYYGALVTDAPHTLPVSGSGDIFTVSGGRVVVTSITGVVSTAIQNQACTLSVGHKPSGGSSQAATLASASSVSNLALATSLSVIAASFPAALAVIAPTSVVPGTDLGAVISLGGLAVVPAGTIQVTTSATNTGAIIWSVSYIPYDAGAYVTAA